MNASPVFLPEHIERLWKASQITNIPLLYTQTALIEGIFNLIREEKIRNGNIRIQAAREDGTIQIGFIPHHYPNLADYQKGVVVSLVNIQRTNPNVKTWNKEVRLAADKIIHNTNVYEVILTSPEGFLLEGSRSNLFGLQKGILVTPPLDMILPGITRQIIIDLSRQRRIPLREGTIHKSDIGGFQSFFITGTSPGILPIRSIGSFHFDCYSSTCNILRIAYEEKIQNSIKNIISSGK